MLGKYPSSSPPPPHSPLHFCQRKESSEGGTSCSPWQEGRGALASHPQGSWGRAIYTRERDSRAPAKAPDSQECRKRLKAL